MRRRSKRYSSRMRHGCWLMLSEPSQGRKVLLMVVVKAGQVDQAAKTTFYYVTYKL
jgi:hypothetical protein